VVKRLSPGERFGLASGIRAGNAATAGKIVPRVTGLEQTGAGPERLLSAPVAVPRFEYTELEIIAWLKSCPRVRIRER
jgi:hypothetical protein